MTSFISIANLAIHELDRATIDLESALQLDMDSDTALFEDYREVDQQSDTSNQAPDQSQE